MEMKTAILITCLLGLAAASRCKNGDFFDRKLKACTACSQCPDDQTVYVLCRGLHDTRCGRYPTFDFLKSGNVITKEDKKETASQIAEVTSSTIQSQEVTASGDNKWYDITMLMVGILVVTCILILVALIITYLVCRRRQQRKIIIRDPAFTSALLTEMDTRKVITLETISET